MTLATLLVIGCLGAVASAWGGERGGRAGRAGAVTGMLALLAVLVLAIALEVPVAGAGGSGSVTLTGGLFDGYLVPSDYLRLVIALWTLDALLLVAIAWLMGGLAELRGLLPAMLAAIVGGTVALAAAPLVLAALAASAAGLAALVVVLRSDRRAVVPAAAGELRVSLGGAALLLAAVVVAPVAAMLVLGDTAVGVETGTVDSSVAATAGQAGAMVGLAALTIALVVGIRAGAIPFHLRVPRLADATPPIAGPLLFAWLPLPVGVVGLAAIDHLVAPLALPLDGERAIIAAFALLTLVAAAVAAFIADDLRHAVGYLVIADAGFVLLGLAAMDPEAWAATRVWLVTLAASKSALAAWAAVMEARFETRSLPDLRGWIRRSPILAAGLAVAVVATFGLPGWVAFEARGDLARLTAGPTWAALVVLAGLLALPAYLRILAVGLGPASTPVRRATPERIVRSRPPSERLVVDAEAAATPDTDTAAADAPTAAVDAGTAAGKAAATTDTGAVAGDAAVTDVPAPTEAPTASGRRRAADRLAAAMVAGRRIAGALRRNRAELTSAAVLALALLAALTSWGALDVGGAAAGPAPIVAEVSSD